jgi:hypothetical protein
MHAKIITVDFSQRGKSLREMKKTRKEEKRNLRMEERIRKAIASSQGVAL